MYIIITKYVKYIRTKSEDGTGSRHPLLGDVGMSPHLFCSYQNRDFAQNYKSL